MLRERESPVSSPASSQGYQCCWARAPRLWSHFTASFKALSPDMVTLWIKAFHIWIGERGVGSVHNTSTSGHLMRRTDSLERPWCWERLRAGGEGDDRGWDGWMASLTQWTWVWVNSGSWWRTGRPGNAAGHGVTKSGIRLINMDIFAVCYFAYTIWPLASKDLHPSHIQSYIHSVLRPQKSQTITESIQSPKFHQLSSPKCHHLNPFSELWVRLWVYFIPGHNSSLLWTPVKLKR